MDYDAWKTGYYDEMRENEKKKKTEDDFDVDEHYEHWRKNQEWLSNQYEMGEE